MKLLAASYLLLANTFKPLALSRWPLAKSKPKSKSKSNTNNFTGVRPECACKQAGFSRYASRLTKKSFLTPFLLFVPGLRARQSLAVLCAHDGIPRPLKGSHKTSPAGNTDANHFPR